MAYAQINPLSSTKGRLLEGEKRLVYWCMLTILHSVFSSWFSISSLFLLFLILSLFFSFFLSAYPCSDVMIFSQRLLLPLWWYYARQGSFIYCLLWLIFTILALNYFFLVWVSLSTTTGLSAVQPPPHTNASCATPHHQTKKIILFACSPWHSYLP